MMIASLSRTLITAQNATGNVRNYQMVVGGVLLLNLPFSYVALKFGFSPVAVVIVAIIIELLAFCARVYMLPLTIKVFSTTDYLNNVFFNCFLVALVSAPFPVLMAYMLPYNFFIFILNVAFCFIISGFVILFIGCSKTERTIIFSKIDHFFNVRK